MVYLSVMDEQTLKCDYCEKEFIPRQKFCSVNCRVKHHQDVHKKTEMEPIPKNISEKKSTFEGFKSYPNPSLHPCAFHAKDGYKPYCVACNQ